jgi:enamine deaminase RidA (YjgF/YER057c/UK114 family)
LGEVVTAPLVVVNPPELGAPRGFAHGIISAAGGRILFVAGQIGTVEGARAEPDDLVAQFDRALARVLVVVNAAGGRADQIARMTVYVTNMERYRASRSALRDVWQRHLATHYPAMALVEVTALVDLRAMVEIEATAVLP